MRSLLDIKRETEQKMTLRPFLRRQEMLTHSITRSWESTPVRSRPSHPFQKGTCHSTGLCQRCRLISDSTLPVHSFDDAGVT